MTGATMVSIGNCRKGSFCVENAWKEELTSIGICTDFGKSLCRFNYMNLHTYLNKNPTNK